MNVPADRFVVDLVQDNGSHTRYVPGLFVAAGLPKDRVEGVTYSRTDAQTGALLFGLAAPDSPENRRVLAAAGWSPES